MGSFELMLVALYLAIGVVLADTMRRSVKQRRERNQAMEQTPRLFYLVAILVAPTLFTVCFCIGFTRRLWRAINGYR